MSHHPHVIRLLALPGRRYVGFDDDPSIDDVMASLEEARSFASPGDAYQWLDEHRWALELAPVLEPHGREQRPDTWLRDHSSSMF